MKKAFTLIEMMVVVGIIGLIASIVLVSLGSARSRAKTAKALQFASSIESGLGAYALGKWDFNEGSGGIVNDNSKLNNHGTITGATWRCASVDEDYTPTGTGCSLEFDGNDNINTVSDLSWTYDDSFTMSAWIKPDVVSGNKAIIGKVLWEYVLFQQNATIRFTLWNTLGAGAIHFATPSVLIAGEWAQVVFTYDGSAHVAKIYVNGEEEASSSIGANTFQNRSETTKIGQSYYGGVTTYFDGLIDEVGIYDEALTTAQIRRLYVKGLKKYKLTQDEL